MADELPVQNRGGCRVGKSESSEVLNSLAVIYYWSAAMFRERLKVPQPPNPLLVACCGVQRARDTTRCRCPCAAALLSVILTMLKKRLFIVILF
jgi:hypothetical protein